MQFAVVIQPTPRRLALCEFRKVWPVGVRKLWPLSGVDIRVLTESSRGPPRQRFRSRTAGPALLLRSEPIVMCGSFA